MFPQIFGKYVLEREMAAGGMARVYLATLRGAVGFEKRLVVKQIRPELASDDGFVRRFVEEAKTAVELTHANIVPVYELGVEQGVYYIAMEFCDGVTLSELLKTTGALDPEEGAYLGVEVCRALEYAHRRAGIVHRDVTPRNVLVDVEGAVRLIDFGIAAPVSVEGGTSTAIGEVFGSPGHMPPEQLAGRELSPATDVFAVGVLLIEAWTGRAPFRRASAAESEAALERAPAPLDQHDERLRPVSDLLLSAVALDPQKRPPNADVLGRQLRDFLRNVDTTDVARRLALRVNRLRASVGAEAAPSTLGVNTPAPPSTAKLRGSTTFAASQQFCELTRKLPSEPPPPEGAVGAPDGAGLEVEPDGAVAEPGDVGFDGVRSEVPGGAGPDFVGSDVADVAGPGGSVTEPGGVRSDGVRVKPAKFESSVPLPAPSSATRDRASMEAIGPSAEGSEGGRRKRLLVFAVLVAGAAGAVLSNLHFEATPTATRTSPAAAAREPAKSAPEQRAATEPTSETTADHTAQAGSVSPSPPVSAPVASTTAIPVQSGSTAVAPPQRWPPRTASAAGSPASAGSAATALGATSPAPASATAQANPKAAQKVGQLTLTSVPPASVAVAGRALSTPVSGLQLEPGTYQVTFRNQTSDEPLAAQVAVGPGETRRVHADFTYQPPRVIVR